MAKSKPKKPKPEPRADMQLENPFAEAEAADAQLVKASNLLSGGLDELERCLGRVKEMLQEGEYDLKVASHLAWMTKTAAQTIAELRKLQERNDKRADKLSPALVMAHLTRLDPERRANVIRTLQAMDSGEGLFS